jgi:S-adenosylmethionine-diacylglycerol 3-amino-3-carboxypropyl transferase
VGAPGVRLAKASRSGGSLRRFLGRVHGLRSGIVFTRVFEDHEVDRRGLAIEPGDAVLVIASAGDKALDAVLWGAGRVTAVDSNVAQLHLLALKLAALRALDSDELDALFSRGRWAPARETYERRLRPLLDAPARRYWDRRIDIFDIGLHEHTTLGLATAGVGIGLRVLGGHRLAPTIMGAPDVEAQAVAYDRRFRPRYWNPVTRWLLGRAILMRAVARDPRERAVMRRERFAEWLEAGVSRVARTSLIRENPYWMPLLAGRPADPEHGLPWLRPASLESMRAAADRVRLVHGSVVDLLEAEPEGSYAAVDLSNVPDWLTPSDRVRLWRGLRHAVQPGGRVLLRSAFRTPPSPTEDGGADLELDGDLSDELTAAERTGIYASVALLRRTADEPAVATAHGRP